MVCPHLCFLGTIWFQTMHFPLELLEKELLRWGRYSHAALPAQSGATSGVWHVPDWDKGRGLGTPGGGKPLLMTPTQ